jgi:hypothetical protein
LYRITSASRLSFNSWIAFCYHWQTTLRKKTRERREKTQSTCEEEQAEEILDRHCVIDEAFEKKVAKSKYEGQKCDLIERLVV